ncbi:transposase [Streptomyces sp. ISL-10]|nr:transposase [Streptomyces sp. ISL-10]
MHRAPGTSSEGEASSTGHGARLTPSASRPQKEATDGTESDRPRKLESKIHLVTDRNGLPLSLGISGAKLHDSKALEPLMRGIPPIRSRSEPRRRRPAKLHADKGYRFSLASRPIHGTRPFRAGPSGRPRPG